MAADELISVKCNTCSLEKEPPLQGEWVRVVSGQEL